MAAAAAWICVLVSVAFARAADVCYDELGCFTTEYPWTDWMRPLPNLPRPPAKVGTQFLLSTRNAPETAISYNDSSFGDFSAARKTVFVIHGFSDSKAGWPTEIKDALLKRDDYNVIVVDWSLGARIPYLQATANTQLVGRQVALLMLALADIGGASVADVHCVGHSLGAHICGYAGNHAPGLGRITGMDPAQPYYEGTQPEVHLDASDALYVDNIHTDGRDTLFLGVGFKEPNGHVDFFPNDGKNQPGCGDLDAEIEGLIWDLATLDLLAISGELSCSHTRSHQLFLESLAGGRDVPLVGFHCPSYLEYVNMSCQTLEPAVIGLMGMDSDRFNLSGNYYLQTTADGDYRYRYYELTIQLSEEQPATVGNMVFVLSGNGTSSQRLPGWSDQVSLSPGGSVRTTLHTAAPLGHTLTSVRVTYHDHSGPVARPLVTSRLQVRSVDEQLRPRLESLCSDGAPVPNQGSAEFTLCS